MVPADGRLRGPDFTAVVKRVSWPQSVGSVSNVFDPPAYVAGSGDRLVAFTLSVTQPPADAGQLNPLTDVTGFVEIKGRQLPISLDMIDGQIADGMHGSTEATGTDSFVASVPANDHSISLGLTEGGFTQQFDLWTLERLPPSPVVLYRAPTSSSVSGTASEPFHLSFTNPADGFSSTDDAQVSSAQLTYFAPGGTLQTPKSTNDAYLVLGIQSSYPDIPYGQPNSGHFFSSFNPMAGTELTFTPNGGSAVDGLSNSSAFVSTNAASDDDGLFDDVYFFTVPATTTGGTLTVNTGQEVGDEYTGFTGTGSSTTINLTASASVPLTFPAVPGPPPAQKTPAWVGAALPATGLGAADSRSQEGGAAHHSFPIWLAVLILVVVAAAVIVAQRLRGRRSQVAAGAPSTAVVAPTPEQPTEVVEPAEASRAAGSEAHPVEDDPRVGVLGPVEISGFGRTNDRRIIDELLVYLVLHDTHHRSAEQIQAALRPNSSGAGNVRKTIHNYLSELRRFVGPEHLPAAKTTGGYLVEGVACDWVTFQRLDRQADAVGGEEARALRAEALALVRGKPFEGVPADSYEWVDTEHLRTTITVAVAKCAQRLGADLFEAGDLVGAESAARAGLRGAPDDFGLWELGACAVNAQADMTGLGRWLSDAGWHLSPAELARIRSGLTHDDPSDS